MKIRFLLILWFLCMGVVCSYSLEGIWKAAAEGDMVTLSNYIERIGVNVDTTDAQSYTPLMYAVKYGQVDVAQYLLKKGASKNQKIKIVHLFIEDEECNLLSYCLYCSSMDCEGYRDYYSNHIKVRSDNANQIGFEMAVMLMNNGISLDEYTIGYAIRNLDSFEQDSYSYVTKEATFSAYQTLVAVLKQNRTLKKPFVIKNYDLDLAILNSDLAGLKKQIQTGAGATEKTPYLLGAFGNSDMMDYIMSIGWNLDMEHFVEGITALNNEALLEKYVSGLRSPEEINRLLNASLNNFVLAKRLIDQGGVPRIGYTDDIAVKQVYLYYLKKVSNIDEIFDYRNNYAWVRAGNKYGAIDYNGNIIFPITLDRLPEIMSSSLNLLIVESGGKKGVLQISYKGRDESPVMKIILPAIYDNFKDYSEMDKGMPIIVIMDGKYGLSLYTGDAFNVIFNTVFATIERVPGSLGVYKVADWEIYNIYSYPIIYMVKKGQGEGKFGFIDRDGRVVIQPIYDYAYPFKNGRARVVQYGIFGSNREFYIDEKGKEIEYSRD